MIAALRPNNALSVGKSTPASENWEERSAKRAHMKESQSKDQWLEAILAGIKRCGAGCRSCTIEDYYRRHKREIDSHGDKDKIINAFTTRKKEIDAEQEKQRMIRRYGL